MKVTNKHFETFKKECEKWIDFYGLKDYEWFFTHKKDEENRASFSCNWAGRQYHISLSTEWNMEKITKKGLCLVAFHEVTEAGLIAELRRMARYAFNQEEIDRASHETVRRLENSVFEKLWDKI